MESRVKLVFVFFFLVSMSFYMKFAAKTIKIKPINFECFFSNFTVIFIGAACLIRGSHHMYTHTAHRTQNTHPQKRNIREKCKQFDSNR